MYRLYVDEVGNDDLGHVHNEDDRYLSLTGIAMAQEYTRDTATPGLNAFKAEIFKHDPDEPILFHRKHIMNKKGRFHCLVDEELRAKFDSGLVDYLKRSQYAVITAVIDKKRMLEQGHWVEKHPYHYLMKILVEKYVQWLERKNGTGDIMPEMRRGKKDTALQRAYTSVRIWGSDYVNKRRIEKAIPSGQLKFRAKEDNITRLQICDLLAHPSHMYVRSIQGHGVTLSPFAKTVVPILLKQKYDRSPWNGTIIGYGIKYLP
jgi:hypothetical protein